MEPTLNQGWNRALVTSPNRLRFELGGAGEHVSMFTHAYDRARELARGAFGASPVAAIIAGDPKPARTPRSGKKKVMAFDVLREMGLPTDHPIAVWRDTWNPRMQDGNLAEFRAVSVTWEQADLLLWSNLAQDIGVEPYAPVRETLVDIERGIAVMVYDDRGMDISALSASDIAPLYARYDGWLLDYDRPRMASVFDAQVA